MEKVVLFLTRTFFLLTVVAGCSSSQEQKVVVIPTAQVSSEEMSTQERQSVQGVPVLGQENTGKPGQRKPASK